METVLKNTTARYILKATFFCIVFTALFVAFSFVKNFFPHNTERITHGILGTFAAFITTILFLKFDRKSFYDIGLTFERKTIFKFLAGTLAGVFLMGAIAASVLYFTPVEVTINPNSNLLHFLFATLPLIPLAFMEELGFRAYPMEILKNNTGIRTALFTTSILFALYHIVNGWTIASSFYGPGVWGLVFGLAAIYSNGIAMPTGLHYAANLTTSAFGAAGNSVSIWIATETGTTANEQASVLVTILPSLALLVFAVICIELFIRRKKNQPL